MWVAERKAHPIMPIQRRGRVRPDRAYGRAGRQRIDGNQRPASHIRARRPATPRRLHSGRSWAACGVSLSPAGWRAYDFLYGKRRAGKRQQSDQELLGVRRRPAAARALRWTPARICSAYDSVPIGPGLGRRAGTARACTWRRNTTRPRRVPALPGAATPARASRRTHYYLGMAFRPRGGQPRSESDLHQERPGGVTAGYVARCRPSQ